MTFNAKLFTLSLVRSGQLVQNVSRGTQAQRETQIHVTHKGNTSSYKPTSYRYLRF